MAALEGEFVDELGCCRPYEEGGADWPPDVELDMIPLEGYSLSAAAFAVLPDIALLRLPAGAPMDPKCCAACRIPEAAPMCWALCCEEDDDDEGWLECEKAILAVAGVGVSWAAAASFGAVRLLASLL
jgi:hypothetical protein